MNDSTFISDVRLSARHLLIRLIANNDLRLQRIGGSGRHFGLHFVVSFELTRQFGMTATRVVLFVQSQATHLKRVAHTRASWMTERRSKRRKERERERKFEERARHPQRDEEGRRSGPFVVSSAISRVRILRVELCIIVTIITPSPPSTFLLTDSVTDSSFLSVSPSAVLRLYTLRQLTKSRCTLATFRNY